MKKSLLVLLAAPLLLASCGESNTEDVNFHNDLHYTDKVTNNDEIDKLKEKFIKNLENVTSVHVEGERTEYQEFAWMETSSVTDIKFYTNSISSVTNEKEHSYRYGVTEDITHPESVSEYWMIEVPGDTGYHPEYRFLSYEKESPKSGTKFSNLQIDLPLTDDDEPVYTEDIHKVKDIHEQLVNLTGLKICQYNYYRVESNIASSYELVFSHQQKQVVEVEGGDGFRERITEVDMQVIAKVEYDKVMSVSSVYVSRRNQDAVTGTWYDEMKVDDSAKSLVTFKYNEKVSPRDLKELSGVLLSSDDNGKRNDVLVSADLRIKTGLYTGTPMSANDFANTKLVRPTTTALNVHYLGTKEADLSGQLSLNAVNCNAFLGKATLEAYVLYSSGQTVSLEKVTKVVDMTAMYGFTEEHIGGTLGGDLYYRYNQVQDFYDVAFHYALEFVSGISFSESTILSEGVQFGVVVG